MVKEIEIKKKTLLGLPIHDFKMQDLISCLNSKIISNEKLIVYGYSVTTYGRLKQLPELISFYNQMDIIVADGAGIPIVSKIFGIQISEHIGIVNLTKKMLKLANEHKYKVLVFGATQEINDLACKKIRAKYPNIKLCKGINGYFKHEHENEIVDLINKEKPDILLIGITSPIKEKFALKYKNKLSTKIIIPCGGMIDVLAGKAKRPKFSPKWFPVTWLYRFFQEPRRLFKAQFLAGLKFVFVIFPNLYIKHKLNIQKNPSIITYLKLNS